MAQAHIDAGLASGLDACKGAARRDKRHICFARLDGDFAQAGGKNAEKLEEALQAVYNIVAELLG